ncbi:UDP-glucose dehydrogenase family protein [Fredinandcohnia humi]
MRNITVIGTGYVGLVTGVCLSEVGHKVTCFDCDKEKISQLKLGKSPIFEPELEELISKNVKINRLSFTTNHSEAFKEAEVIYLAVGTPQKEDGNANLDYIFQAAMDISNYAKGNVIVVTKSTVPVGTNEIIKSLIQADSKNQLKVEVVSNPEFLREGQAIHDTFNGDRIVIGSSSNYAAEVISKIYEPFNIPIIHTDIRSAEMIKYASNAFLATKISFINEISSICEKLGANIDDVAHGMGMDSRIGTQFLRAGIGYGGSCFPKDTKALVQIAGEVNHKFELLEAVIHINNKQQIKLVTKAKERCGSLQGKKVAMLGLAFKPNTNDIREAASLQIANHLLIEGANVIAYDPVAVELAKKHFPQQVKFTSNLIEALHMADIAFIVTEWEDIVKLPLKLYEIMMKTPIIFDGRNCYPLREVNNYQMEYHSIGRSSILNLPKEVAYR